MRVLLVDDDRLALLMLGEGMVAAGLNVTSADSGEGALAHLKAGESFDVIVSDIQMPQMDGMALAALVRQMQRDDPTSPIAPTRLVALTGSISNAQDRERVLAVFDDVLSKPVSVGFLIKSLQSLLAGGQGRANTNDGDRVREWV